MQIYMYARPVTSPHNAQQYSWFSHSMLHEIIESTVLTMPDKIIWQEQRGCSAFCNWYLTGRNYNSCISWIIFVCICYDSGYTLTAKDILAHILDHCRNHTRYYRAYIKRSCLENISYILNCYLRSASAFSWTDSVQCPYLRNEASVYKIILQGICFYRRLLNLS